MPKATTKPPRDNKNPQGAPRVVSPFLLVRPWGVFFRLAKFFQPVEI